MSNAKLRRKLEQSPLYSHQAAAIDAVFEGGNVCIATGTASGKSRAFMVPCMEVLKADKDSRCLFIYPMKALAQDQARATRELAHEVVYKRLRVDTYDGDTPEKERAGIRKSGRIVLTNPDMLHVGILPNHEFWRGFLSNLAFVVIDEAHIYKGVFGSHMALILRRLRRLCKHYGCCPQFILSSATIANPGPFCAALVGLPVTVVSDSGAGCGARTFCLWNPQLLDADATRRKSAAVEATGLFTELLRKGLKSICFVRARKTAEVVLKQTCNRLRQIGRADLQSRVRSYRGGYLPQERRAIEQSLFNGELLGVTATTALELGVDVGDMNATLHVGFPGSIASMWQQAGRAGRSGNACVSVIIGTDSGLDQYYMQNPEQLFGAPSEEVCIDPWNGMILEPQLAAAAAELPLSAGDREMFSQAHLSMGRAQPAVEGGTAGPSAAFDSAVQRLCARGSGVFLRDGLSVCHAQQAGPPAVHGAVLRSKGLAGGADDSGGVSQWDYVGSSERPCMEFNIRGSGNGPKVRLVQKGSRRLIEEIDEVTACRQAHKGAVYMHQSVSYVVESLDLKQGVATAVRNDSCQYYTESRERSELSVKRQRGSRAVGASTIRWGELRVHSQVVSFVRKQIYTDGVVKGRGGSGGSGSGDGAGAEEPLDLEPTIFATQGCWWELPPELVTRLVKTRT